MTESLRNGSTIQLRQELPDHMKHTASLRNAKIYL